MLGRERLRSAAFDQVIGHAPILAITSAPLLRALTTAEVCEDLPAIVEARARESDSFGFHMIGIHEWHRLAISSEPRSFAPPSPTREPFAALFAKAPDEARALVREIVNHAITAWRQLHTLDPQRPGTPIPLVLTFPWGAQTFWGDVQVYQWFQGIGAPDPVDCALMALERWAFQELRMAATSILSCVTLVEGHDSAAVLGIGVALALTAQTATPGLLPIATAQRLRRWEQG